MRAPSTTTKAEWPPNYTEVYKWRQKQVARWAESAEMLASAKAYYSTRPVAWINHWVSTYDPRLATHPTKAAYMPLVMFERQAEMIEFVWACISGEEGGLIEKSRDMGATWACCAFSIWLWFFWPGAAIGWGSRDAHLVDRIGDLGSIFEKMRMILRSLPKAMKPIGFTSEHARIMKIVNPENGSSIIGETGDNIGRGGRTLCYFKDESGHYQRPESIEAALSQNTRVQIDISSVHGLGNLFHRRREAGVDWTGGEIVKGFTQVFVLDWRDHPEKNDAWYLEERAHAEREGILHLFAQEVDRDYAASVEGILIQVAWFKAAIDAAEDLGFNDDGGWVAGLDVADEGHDTNALSKRKGVVLKSLEEWGERDTGATARRAVGACTDPAITRIDLQYDCIGMGSSIKAETNRLRDAKLLPKSIRMAPWNAGLPPLKPDGFVIDRDRNSGLNKDFFQNIKAQAWWQLARRLERTYRARHEKGFTWKPSELISIPSKLPLLRKLEKELCQVRAIKSPSTMKMKIDKSPEGTKSPNCGDAVVMAFWPAGSGYDISVLGG